MKLDPYEMGFNINKLIESHNEMQEITHKNIDLIQMLIERIEDLEVELETKSGSEAL